MNAFINAITDPRLLFMWFSFIFLALASLLLGMVEHWPWGAIFFVGGPVTLLALDMAHDESIAGKANGGPFHHFFIFVFSFSAVGLIVLTVLTAFGVLQGGYDSVDPGNELRLVVYSCRVAYRPCPSHTHQPQERRP